MVLKSENVLGMNRGRRRGGSSGLAGLRDGVKRRLFDPHLVPTKPDAKYEVNRLIPLLWDAPEVSSRLSQLRGGDFDDKIPCSTTTPEESELYGKLFKTKALMEFAFRTGPFYHPLPEVQEGIAMTRALVDPHDSEADKPKEGPISTLHLILARKEITFWSSDQSMKKLYDPDSWYPKELSLLTKRSRRQLATIRKRKRLAVQAASTDLGELVSDQLIARAVETTGVIEGEEPAEEVVDAASDADSDDARWNGEVNPDAADPEELDEEELDNDYCQNYFDNGEADFSDDNLGGDDDDGNARYYD
ncbi:hypothetical protein D915_002352 [Fasciola hepatica]|uniref:DNA-directed RNA polymerase III subunit n=1 Tax=Fasciola hepatica TaxID=6192 RepID=A0A4E0S328_FASHE|nr:hypothetical protein D915_002352 [Fasciola hepatica]